MSEARKCDRCHGFYEIPMEQQDRNAAYDNKGSFAKLFISNDNRQYPENVKWYDLCPNCVELLTNWVENPDNYDPHDLINYACTDRTERSPEEKAESARELEKCKAACIDRSNGGDFYNIPSEESVDSAKEGDP